MKFDAQAIYFDTNPLIGAGWPKPSAQLQGTISAAAKLGIPVFIPELVKRELAGHWIREAQAKWQQAIGAISQANKLSLGVTRFSAAPPLSIAELQVAAEKAVEEFTKGMTPVSQPAKTLDEFLSHAIRREMTFGDGGKG